MWELHCCCLRITAANLFYYYNIFYLDFSLKNCWLCCLQSLFSTLTASLQSWHSLQDIVYGKTVHWWVRSTNGPIYTTGLLLTWTKQIFSSCKTQTAISASLVRARDACWWTLPGKSSVFSSSGYILVFYITCTLEPTQCPQSSY